MTTETADAMATLAEWLATQGDAAEVMLFSFDPETNRKRTTGKVIPGPDFDPARLARQLLPGAYAAQGRSVASKQLGPSARFDVASDPTRDAAGFPAPGVADDAPGGGLGALVSEFRALRDALAQRITTPSADADRVTLRDLLPLLTAQRPAGGLGEWMPLLTLLVETTKATRSTPIAEMLDGLDRLSKYRDGAGEGDASPASSIVAALPQLLQMLAASTPAAGATGKPRRAATPATSSAPATPAAAAPSAATPAAAEPGDALGRLAAMLARCAIAPNPSPKFAASIVFGGLEREGIDGGAMLEALGAGAWAGAMADQFDALAPHRAYLQSVETELAALYAADDTDDAGGESDDDE